jgi:hypothetical protein
MAGKAVSGFEGIKNKNETMDEIKITMLAGEGRKMLE